MIRNQLNNFVDFQKTCCILMHANESQTITKPGGFYVAELIKSCL